jgi:hypothetical protein
MNPALLNGHPKCTLIESFDGKVFIVRSGKKHQCRKGLERAKKLIERMGWEVNIDHVKGSPILRRMT